jgi:hypothetical protein
MKIFKKSFNVMKNGMILFTCFSNLYSQSNVVSTAVPAINTESNLLYSYDAPTFDYIDKNNDKCISKNEFSSTFFIAQKKSQNKTSFTDNEKSFLVKKMGTDFIMNEFYNYNKIDSNNDRCIEISEYRFNENKLLNKPENSSKISISDINKTESLDSEISFSNSKNTIKNNFKNFDPNIPELKKSNYIKSMSVSNDPNSRIKVPQAILNKNASRKTADSLKQNKSTVVIKSNESSEN